jgi:hypothetical protein
LETDAENKKDKPLADLASSLPVLSTEEQWAARAPTMKGTTKVLLLGIEEWRIAVRQALPPKMKSSIGGVKNFWDLCALPEAVLVDVAVIHQSVDACELRYAAEYIRRRWPDAVILVLGEQAEHLDDPLYDDKTSSEISMEELVRVIERLVAAKRWIGRNAQFGHGYARR